MWLTIVLKALAVVLLAAGPSRGGTITPIPITQIASAPGRVTVVPTYPTDLAVVEGTDNFTGQTSIRTIAVFLGIDLGWETPKRESRGLAPFGKGSQE